MKNKKKKFMMVFAAFVIMAMAFVVLEPALTNAAEDSDDVTVNLTVNEAITIDAPADVTMTDIDGQGTSTGNVDWTVRTNNSDGYTLVVSASEDPAMANATDSFADYTEAVPGTPEAWSVAAADSEFGFSASGADALASFNAGAAFVGFQGATDIQVATDAAETLDAGTVTNVNFQAEVGTSHIQASGLYDAVVTATATTL